MATSRSTANLKARKALSSSTTSTALNGGSLHGRRSPKSSVHSSPEREATRSTQRRPLLSPSGSISRTAKNRQPSSATIVPSRHRPATKKPSDQKPLSSTLQPKPTSTSQASRQPSSTTVKERTTPRTSSSSMVSTGISSKPITGTKTTKPVRRGTSQPSVRARSTGSVTKEKETSVSPAFRSTSDDPIDLSELEEENDSISFSWLKDCESDDLKETLETSVSEAEFLSEQSDRHEADPSAQASEPAPHVYGCEKRGDGDDKDSEEECSNEKQAAAEKSKEPSAESVAVAEPIASAEQEKESATKKTAVRVMTYKKPEVVQGWKVEAPKNNEVLEEARSKLLERKKSKVLALVGAFETVMSLQEPEGQTQETRTPK